jgi:hypothetical protein
MANGINHPQNQITEPTRRNIADELRLRNLDPSGRLDEVAFLSRMFDLKSLPTTDYRKHEFPDMAADVWQHRVNNRDWDDGWFWTDPRLNLLRVPDDVFLQFLAEMVHPVVRGDAGERDVLLELFNRHLAPEGWEVGEVNRVGGHPVYGGRRLTPIPAAAVADAKAVAETLGTYVARQVTRMEAALSGDLELAIGTAKEFIETVCRTILKERGIDLPKDDDLPALMKLTVKNLPIVPDGIDDKAKWEGTVVRLVNNLSSTGQSLAELRNAFGTGHGKDATHKGLDTHHARLIVHTASTVGVFLYETHDRHTPAISGH